MKCFLQFLLNIPYSLYAFIRLHIKHVKYGKKLKVYGKLMIYGEKGKIEIGNFVTINSSVKYVPNGSGLYTSLWSNGGEIYIGNYVGMTRCSIVSQKRVVIEDNVFLGAGSKIYDTDFHPLDYEKRISGQDILAKTDEIVIKEGAFIGAMSIILKGVTIGKHSIVGAGSVVTKSIPDGEIWAGNPAIFIRKIEL